MLLSVLLVPVLMVDPTAAAKPPVSAVVQIASGDSGLGSGVLVNRSGPHAYVLSADHVVDRAKTVDVRFANGKRYKAEIVARSADADLVVLRFATGDELPAAVSIRPASEKDATAPKGVVSGGWETGDAPTTRDEAVEAREKVRRPGQAASTWHWRTAKKPVPGRSGGPLLDAKNCLVGIASGHDGVAGYYVHVSEVHALLLKHGLEWIADPEN